MTERPLVSVIIPTYNRRQQVVEAIDSALAQTYEPLEVIVVDDGSTDGTGPSLRAQYGTRIRLVVLPVNVGGAQARNVGVAQAQGACIAFLDSDDRWSCHKIASQVQVLHQHACDVVYTGMYRVCCGTTLAVNTPRHAGTLCEALLTANVVSSTSSVLLRKDLFMRVGGFNRALPACQDWDLWIRLAKIARFGCVREPLVYHRLDGKDRISSNPQARLQGLFYMYRTYIRQSGNTRGIANVLFNIGKALYMQHRLRYAACFLRRSLWMNKTKYKAVAYLGLCLLQSTRKRAGTLSKKFYDTVWRVALYKHLF